MFFNRSSNTGLQMTPDVPSEADGGGGGGRRQGQKADNNPSFHTMLHFSANGTNSDKHKEDTKIYESEAEGSAMCILRF